MAQNTQNQNGNEREKGLFEQFEEFKSMTSALEKNFAIEDLLTDAFLQKYTQFQTLADFTAACGGSIHDVDDLEKLEDTSFLQKTQFESVEALLDKAMEEYVDSFFGDDE